LSDLLASRLVDASNLVRWFASGLPLRRWLANCLLTHARNRAEGRGAWWDLFRLHGMQGMSYAEACRITGIAPSNATNVHRAVVGRLRAALGAILSREGIRAEDIDRELALMQDFLG
jgi:hypothetical protein